MSNSLLLQKTVLEPKNFLTHVTNWVSLVKGAQVALSIVAQHSGWECGCRLGDQVGAKKRSSACRAPVLPCPQGGAPHWLFC